MGKVVAIEHLTLDGVMQSPARPDEDSRDGFDLGGWANAGNDRAMQQAMGERMGASWCLLVGRVTYEDFAGVWPKRTGDPISEVLNKVEKFVASNTLSEPLPWQNSTLLNGDAAEKVARLKLERAQNLVIFGSGVLVQSLLRRNLVDEFVLQIHPLVLGRGRRLFPHGTSETKLSLVKSQATATGVIIATYQAAGTADAGR